jgi:T-complex protein 1 subunit theta
MQGLEEAVYRNISACREMTEITKTSFGPNGKNRILIYTRF